MGAGEAGGSSGELFREGRKLAPPGAHAAHFNSDSHDGSDGAFSSCSGAGSYDDEAVTFIDLASPQAELERDLHTPQPYLVNAPAPVLMDLESQEAFSHYLSRIVSESVGSSSVYLSPSESGEDGSAAASAAPSGTNSPSSSRSPGPCYAELEPLAADNMLDFLEGLTLPMPPAEFLGLEPWS